MSKGVQDLLTKFGDAMWNAGFFDATKDTEANRVKAREAELVRQEIIRLFNSQIR